ncbi:MAG: glycosyltransferase family 2 protein [Acidimicrobiia bacterium]
MPDVVLPVLDEAHALPHVLASLPVGYEPVVVDNGSRDGSAAVARRLGARVVHEPRRGFGAACFTGLQAARADIVCFMDCDGSLDGADLPAVAGPVLAGEADLVLGRRVTQTAGAWPRHARVANRALAWWLRGRGLPGVHDLGPMRATRRLDLLALELRDRRFGWPLEMVVAAGAAGWRLAEVPVSYAPRLGRSKVTGTFRGTVRTVLDMARVAR